MESSRRLVSAAAAGVGVLVAAAISDFVVGSFWSGHAMLTSLLASLIVLAVTVVVLNEWLDRRDRRRWSLLAQYVLFQLVQAARATWIGLLELIEERPIESGTAALTEAAQLALDTASLSAATRTMLADAERRRILQELMVAIAAHSRSVVAAWASVMVGSGPYTEIFDRHVELQGYLDWISDILSHNEPNARRSIAQAHLARTSVAAEHAGVLGSDESLHDLLVAATQLAVALDTESRALGFRLVPMEWWQQRTQQRATQPPALSG